MEQSPNYAPPPEGNKITTNPQEKRSEVKKTDERDNSIFRKIQEPMTRRNFMKIAAITATALVTGCVDKKKIIDVLSEFQKEKPGEYEIIYTKEMTKLYDVVKDLPQEEAREEDVKKNLVEIEKSFEFAKFIKDELREGIKGYYTNLKNIEDSLIVSRYKDLWHVEKSFRIAKSDLEMRPIYHFKEETIQAHILICFMALSIVKFIEIRTGKSIKSIIKLLKGVTDARLLNMITNEEIVLRSEVSKEIKQLLHLMEPWY